MHQNIPFHIRNRKNFWGEGCPQTSATGEGPRSPHPTLKYPLHQDPGYVTVRRILCLLLIWSWV